VTQETRCIDLSRIPLNPFQIEGWLDRLMASLAWPSVLEPAEAHATLAHSGEGACSRQLAGPMIEGVYTLLARVERLGTAPVLLEELIGVGAPAGP
jgi:hypothetical protein